jgi:hypothetical protein
LACRDFVFCDFGNGPKERSILCELNGLISGAVSCAMVFSLLLVGAPAWSQRNAQQDGQAEGKIIVTMKDDLANRSPDIH